MKARAAAIAAILGLDIFGAPLAAGAQQAGKISRIGVPSSQSPEGYRALLVLRDGLRKLGYVEGQTPDLEVAEVRITFEEVDPIIGAYDRVRYKLAVEALGEDGQRVDVRTSVLVIVEADGEILWLGGTEWFDFGRGGGGSVSLQGISDGFVWSSTVKLRVVGFADDKVATDAVIVFR